MEKLPSEIKNKYMSYFYDYSHDDRLDSDEKVWVNILRSDVKPWTNVEEKRSKEISDLIFKLQNTGDEWEEFYTDGEGELIKSYDLIIPGRKQTEICIYKNWMVYAKNWDENDNRVKRGAKVKGTVYYDISDDGDIIDENIIGYKTLSDAQHAVQLYVKDVREAYGIKEQNMNKNGYSKVTDNILSGMPIREALHLNTESIKLSSSKSFTLSDLLNNVPTVDVIDIQNNNGSLFTNKFSYLCTLNLDDKFMDPEGSEYTINQILSSKVTLVRSFRDVLIIGIDL